MFIVEHLRQEGLANRHHLQEVVVPIHLVEFNIVTQLDVSVLFEDLE